MIKKLTSSLKSLKTQVDAQVVMPINTLKLDSVTKAELGTLKNKLPKYIRGMQAHLKKR